MTQIKIACAYFFFFFFFFIGSILDGNLHAEPFKLMELKIFSSNNIRQD